jgi:DNA mismatch repair protein MutS
LKNTEAKPVYQLNMFQTADPKFEELKRKIEKIDINTLSPIEALLELQKIIAIVNC